MNRIEKIELHGKPYVALPMADYEKLLEAMEDIADAETVREALLALARGEETFPASLVYALAKAETTGERIALWRKHRGITQLALAEHIGCSKQYVTMLEGSKRTASTKDIRAIAQALSCDINDLI